MAGKTQEEKLAGQTMILVDFPPRPGVVKVSTSPEDMAERSARAVDRAMQTIREMAERVTATVRGIAEKPQQVEVAFGLKLDAEVGALIAKTGVEASINVKITWKNS